MNNLQGCHTNDVRRCTDAGLTAAAAGQREGRGWREAGGRGREEEKAGQSRLIEELWRLLGGMHDWDSVEPPADAGLLLDVQPDSCGPPGIFFSNIDYNLGPVKLTSQTNKPQKSILQIYQQTMLHEFQRERLHCKIIYLLTRNLLRESVRTGLSKNFNWKITASAHATKATHTFSEQIWTNRDTSCVPIQSILAQKCTNSGRWRHQNTQSLP